MSVAAKVSGMYTTQAIVESRGHPGESGLPDEVKEVDDMLPAS